MVDDERTSRQAAPEGTRRAAWSVVVVFLAFTFVFAPGRMAMEHQRAEDAADEAAASAEPGRVTLVGRAFAPPTITVAAGSVVTWTNDDPGPHTVVADDGSFDSGPLEGGATFEATIDRTTPYHCGYHPEMTGTIDVEG
jgi:plastocyanin